MKTSTFITLLAAWASAVRAQSVEEDITTTITSTTTMTYVLTECAPGVADCPANTPKPTDVTEPSLDVSEPAPESTTSEIPEPEPETTTTETVVPVPETTSEAPEPEFTTSEGVSSSIFVPIQNTTFAINPTLMSSKPPILITETSFVEVPTTTATTETPSTVPDSGASGLVFESSLLLGAVFVGMVALA